MSPYRLAWFYILYINHNRFRKESHCKILGLEKIIFPPVSQDKNVLVTVTFSSNCPAHCPMGNGWLDCWADCGLGDPMHVELWSCENPTVQLDTIRRSEGLRSAAHWDDIEKCSFPFCHYEILFVSEDWVNYWVAILRLFLPTWCLYFVVFLGWKLSFFLGTWNQKGKPEPT